ncbi:MAG: hypothetical protein ACKVHP_03465 [Verrucomicrobiales bacterium]|jgi:hypothetical protein
MTSAEVDVLRGKVAVSLSVMLEDLVLFHGLKASSQASYSAGDLRQAALDHQVFLLKYFSIRDAEGNRLTGVISDVDYTSISDKEVPQSELMKQQIVYAMDYSVTGPQEFLTFMQSFGADESLVPAVMDFNVLQTGIWLDKPLQLMGGQVHTIAFDWESPPDLPPANWGELRAKREAEHQRRLGITSYTGLYSYIYVTDTEVRHEILVPLLTFEQWQPIHRANEDFVGIVEQEAARNVVAAFFRDRNPLDINGARVEPTLERLQFFGLDINDFALNAAPRRVSAHQARLGIILSYPANETPQQVRMTWDTFSEQTAFLRSGVYIGDEDPKEHYFVRDDPEWQWTRPLTAPSAILTASDLAIPPPASGRQLPIMILIAGAVTIPWFLFMFWRGRTAIALFGSALYAIIAIMSWPKTNSPLTESDARAIGSTLLQRLYRAFDYRSEEEIYEALAESVHGPLLDEMYTGIYGSLHMEEQGGAKARVQEITIVSDVLTENRPAESAFRYHCGWQVTGTVEHWGHIHTRENRYGADFTINAVAGAWRITGYQLTDEQRVRFETGVRSLR